MLCLWASDFRWDLFLTMVVAVAGWIAAFVLNKKAFRDKVINDARLFINEAIRDYQLWLNECQSFVRAYFAAPVQVRPDLLQEVGLKLADQSRAWEWAFRLNEHEAIFPEIRDLTKVLSDKNTEINLLLGIALGLEDGTLGEQERGAGKEVERRIIEQNLVVTELRTYLQNRSLGRLFRRSVKPPTRGDREPFLRFDKKTRQLRMDWDQATEHARALIKKEPPGPGGP